jgi:HPt (histidine-containing phosphotransfer) domain-containing protein
MVKQRNIFTGKVDILTDPSDSREQVARALHALGSNAGRLITERGKAPAPQIEKQVRQTKLF